MAGYTMDDWKASFCSSFSENCVEMFEKVNQECLFDF